MHFRGILCAFTPTCEVNFGFLTQFWFICSEGLTALSRFSVRLSCMSTPLLVWLYLAGKTACCLYSGLHNIFLSVWLFLAEKLLFVLRNTHSIGKKFSPYDLIRQDNEKGKFPMTMASFRWKSFSQPWDFPMLSFSNKKGYHVPCHI